jgi:hypothetical protein
MLYWMGCFVIFGLDIGILGTIAFTWPLPATGLISLWGGVGYGITLCLLYGGGLWAWGRFLEYKDWL